MKTIEMDRDFYYRPNGRVVIKYTAGAKYGRVPEAAVREILKANAGLITAAKPRSRQDA